MPTIRQTRLRLFTLLLPAFLLVAAATGIAAMSLLVSSQQAMADDDDGGDDDGGGASGGGGGGGAENSKTGKGPFFKKKRSTKKVRRPPPRPARPTIVALDLSDAMVQTLTSTGYVVLRDETLTSAGVRVQKLRLPRNRSVRQAQAEILALGGAAADRNAFYRPQQDTDCTNGDRCGTRQLIDWPATLRGSCLADVRIGVVDTRINLAHPALAGQNIETLDLKPPGYRQSGSDHGTAVISILVGNPQGPAPGLLPQASVVHADPYFRSSKGGDLAEIVDVVRAVDAVLERKVSVINMSMSGPANTVVEKVLERASASGIAIVAAVGNAGPRARPLYPAAYDVTVSVTAIGEGLSIYRRAGQGQHVDFAAPGVALDVAGGRRGTVRKTGTSFAAPFVTASLAAMKAGDATRSVQELVNELAQSARDLGKPGKDPVFGWGLVQAQGVCRTLS